MRKPSKVGHREAAANRLRGHFRPAGRASVGIVAKGAEVIPPPRLSPLSLRRNDYVKPVVIEPPPGWENAGVARCDCVFCIDDSGSMYGPGGDPEAKRRAAALSVVDFMRRGGGGRVGVVHYGDSAPEQLARGLTVINKNKAIAAALEIPASLGGTNVVSGLSRAVEILSASSPGRVPLVIVISDGVELAGRSHRLAIEALPPGCVHVLLLDSGRGCNEMLEAAWRSLPLGSFIRLNHADNSKLAHQAADVVAGAFGTSVVVSV